MNRNIAVEKLVNEWRKVYESDHPLAVLEEIDGQFPTKIVEDSNQSSFLLPEPFYGPFDGDMKNDILVLLTNPGEVKEQPRYAPPFEVFNRTNFEPSDFAKVIK